MVATLMRVNQRGAKHPGRAGQPTIEEPVMRAESTAWDAGDQRRARELLTPDGRLRNP